MTRAPGRALRWWVAAVAMTSILACAPSDAPPANPSNEVPASPTGVARPPPIENQFTRLDAGAPDLPNLPSADAGDPAPADAGPGIADAGEPSPADAGPASVDAGASAPADAGPE